MDSYIQKKKQPKAGTSGTNNKGGTINLISDSEETDDNEFETEDDISCCDCGKWQLNQLKESDFITKWTNYY